MSPKEREAERVAQEAIQKKIRANYVKQKRKSMSKITDKGVLALQYELELLGSTPSLKPDNGLGLSETLEAMQEALDHHLNKLK
jgi:hypothetical protein